MNICYIHRRNLLTTLGAFLSLLIYVGSPNQYVYEYNLLCGIFYIVSVLLYFKGEKKINYFDFETIFLLSFFFCFFVYPIFIYRLNPEYFIMFSFEFDHSRISQGTALSLVGSQFFLLGSTVGKRIQFNKLRVIAQNHICCSKKIHLITISLFVLFVISGGLDALTNLYSKTGNPQSNLFAYILVLYVSFYILSVTFEFDKLSKINLYSSFLKKINKPFLLFTFIASLLLLLTGSRTVLLQMLLSFMGLFCMSFYPVGIKKFFLMAVIGAVVLTFISVLRIDGEVHFKSIWDIFMDLIINNRSTYVSLSYVEENGLTYGRSMLGYILKCIPFLQGIFCDIFNVNPKDLTSAMIITRETLGDDPSVGLGTNIIADVYLAFGLLGVTWFMYILGYFSKKTLLLAQKGSIYNLLFYTVLLSLSIYMVRSEFFYGANLVVWTFIITNSIRQGAKKKSQ